MEGDLTTKINEIRAMVEENNKMLKTIRRHERIAGFMRLLYWVVIIGIGIGSYYYIQPLLDPFISSYKNIKEAETKLNNFPTSWSDVKNYFGSNATSTE